MAVLNSEAVVVGFFPGPLNPYNHHNHLEQYAIKVFLKVIVAQIAKVEVKRINVLAV